MLLKAPLANRAQLCSPENKRSRSPEQTHKVGDGVFPKQVHIYSSEFTFSFQLTTVTLSLISSCFCNRSSVIYRNCTHKCSRTKLLRWYSPAVDMPVPTDVQVAQRQIFQNCLLRYYSFYSPDSHCSYYCLTIIQLPSNSLT